MRFFIFFIFLFSTNVFAELYVKSGDPFFVECRTNNDTDYWEYNANKSIKYHHYTADKNAACGTKWKKYTQNYNRVTSCPTGQTPDSNEICQPPQNCSWATTPPWFVIPNTNVVQCNTTGLNGLSADNTQSYLSNAQYCTSDSTCYGKLINCPTGMVFSKSQQKCVIPSPDSTKCPAGYYTKTSSTSIDGITKSCYLTYICKTDPSIRFDKIVSCGVDPEQTEPYQTPSGTTQDSPQSSSSSTKDQSTKCGTEKMLAQSSCALQPRHYLVFECDPLTGMVKKSQCLPTETSPQTPIESGDDQKGSTTADIKDLANKLPDSIRTALKDFFSDGSMSHLESIRGSAESSLLLDADRNDKLDNLGASVDAGLVLQSDSNEKLDGIKSSADAIKGSVDAQKPILDQIADFFSDDTQYEGEDVTQGNLNPDSNSTDGFDTFTLAYDQITNQFNQASNVFSSGVPNITFEGGSCPSYSFMGNSVSLSSIGQSIAPFSSILSILIYISLMINAFRLLFAFLSRGV